MKFVSMRTRLRGSLASRCGLLGRSAPRSAWIYFWGLCLTLASHAWSQSAAVGSSPQYRILWINEVQSQNQGTISDSFQETDPWIELYNPGQKFISLDGFALSDNYHEFQKWRFPKGSGIEPGQYLLIWMDGQPEQSTATEPHCSFRLKPGGGSLAISTLVNGNALVVDFVDYPSIGVDFSWGLDQVGATSSEYHLFARPTPRATNVYFVPLVINEWYIAPTNGQPGWFEIYNPNDTAVDPAGFIVSMIASDLPSTSYTLPRGHRIPSEGFLRIWADGGQNPTLDPLGIHAPFFLVSRPFVLQIARADGLVISQITTKASNPFLPEARYPDGARFVSTVNVATPGKPNVGIPRFITSPSSLVLREGEPLLWKAAAIGTQPIRYQWWFNQKPIPGQTNPILSYASVLPSQEGSYELRASNIAGDAFTDARLIVQELPRINVDAPSTLSVPIGKAFRLPAGIASTSNYKVQWKRNGVNVPSALDSVFSKDGVSIEDGGRYTAVVENAVGASVSLPIQVLIDVPVVKAADAFAEALDLSTKLFQSPIRGNNRFATKELGEPQHAGNAGGKSVWFKWRPSTTGIATFHTRGSTFDTLLAVYTGAAVNQLKSVVSDDDNGSYYTSEVKFNATPRTTYMIALDGYGGDTNDFVLSWSLETTDLQIPIITKHPSSLTVVRGGTATFRVAASSNTAAYQWLFNGNRIPGETKDTLTIPKVDFGNIGLYSVRVVSTDKLSVDSHFARLEIGDVPRDPSEDKYEPPYQPFKVPQLTGMDFPELAGVPTVSVSAGTVGSQWLTLKGSATQASEPPPCGKVGGNSRFQTFLLTGAADMEIDTAGSSYNTILTVYALGAKPPFEYVTCNNDGSTSMVRFHGKANTQYYAFVDSADGVTNGLTQINWTCGYPPQLTHPVPPSTNQWSLGQRFTLEPIISAVPPVSSIQWFLNDVPLTGMNTLNYTNNNPGADSTGNYSLIASNALGTVTGLVANVYIDVPFQLSAKPVPVPEGNPDIIIQGLAQQGFLVEASLDLEHWCWFYKNQVPLDPFSYPLNHPESYDKLYFRCQPWPVDVSYTNPPCAAGFP